MLSYGIILLPSYVRSLLIPVCFLPALKPPYNMGMGSATLTITKQSSSQQPEFDKR